MKNGLFIWNVILSIVAGVLLFLQFGTKKKNSSGSTKTVSDTSVSKEFRIAYLEMDSLEANFNLVKDVKAEISAKETVYTNSINQLDEVYKRKFNELNKENMTTEQVQAAELVLRQLSESLKAQRQDLDQKFQEFVMLKNLDLKNKIKEYLKKYNKSKNYTFIFSYEPDLFYFKDTAYNITAELIHGLNEEYKQVKK